MGRAGPGGRRLSSAVSEPVSWARLITVQPWCPRSPYIYHTEDSQAWAHGRVYSMVVMTAKTWSEAPGRGHVLGEANRGRCGDTCAWWEARSESDRGGGQRRRPRSCTPAAFTWEPPAGCGVRQRRHLSSRRLVACTQPPLHERPLGNTTPTDGQRDSVLVRAPGIGD